MIEMALPWPPSVNHYYRRVGLRTLISREGRRYRRVVVGLLAAMRAQPLRRAVRIEIDAYPPDRRPRDLDNLLKSLIDSIQHAGMFEDDAQISDLHVRRRWVHVGGKCVVRIAESPGDA